MKAELIDPSDRRWLGFLNDTEHDFYHLPGYAAISARRDGNDAKALYVVDGPRQFLAPLIIRPLPDDRWDATSPYGYPGPLASHDRSPDFTAAALLAGGELLREQGVVTAFVRFHPILSPVPEGVDTLVRHCDTVAIDLLECAEATWSAMRRNHRVQIAQAIDAGHRFTIGRDQSHATEFKDLYRRTMQRLDADDFYFFDDAHFDDLGQILSGHVFIAVVEVGGRVVAAGYFVETCGIVEFHLAGSDERYAGDHPIKLMVHRVAEWARARGYKWLHLGGGRGGESDSLLHFKSGFSRTRLPYHTLRMVFDDAEYSRLIPQHDPTAQRGYFPAYRQPRALAASAR